jgi:ribosomal protein S18 acetylase RimI-like enzyme
VPDNVVWAALTGPHAALGLGRDGARRYHPEIAPFGAAPDFGPGSLAALAGLVEAGASLALVTCEEVAGLPGLEPVLRASVDRMVLTDAAACAADAGQAGDPIVPLSTADVPCMLALTAATRPGPFGPRTIELGAYCGIRVQGALVAMAGERLRVPGFTEISAVCVDPSCRGRGYAARLMAGVAAPILARGEVPFLHVLSDNLSAIALYRKLGFRLLRQVHFAVFARPSAA